MTPFVRVAAGVSLAFTLTGAVASPARPSLLQQVLADRRAVESVLWEHRIWPSTNPRMKPEFSQALPEGLLQSRVREDLARSAALGAYWSRPLSGEELQSEIDRMAAHTRDPALLRQLFAALDDDPERIAYALALPALADRRLRDWYAWDDRFHGNLRAAAERTLSPGGGVETAGRRGGEYLELEYLRTDERDGKREAPEGAGGPILLSREEWTQLAGRLADSFGLARARQDPGAGTLLERLPLHRAGALREEPDRFVSTTLLERSADRIKLALTTWRKRPFDAWWAEARESLDPASGIPAPHHYTLPDLPSQACRNDTWDGVHTAVPDARTGNSMIWTGTEVIVWGGRGFADYLNTGHRYHPATDTWSATGVDASTPTPRTLHTAVWTGSEMIVWGGIGPGNTYLGTGARYDPLTDIWTPVRMDGTSPTPRRGHSALWTGSRMIVWGGSSPPFFTQFQYPTYLNSGAIYDPGTDSWTPTRNDATTPEVREGQAAAWTGTEMIVWGGHREAPTTPWTVRDLGSGGRYNPASNTWSAMGGSPPQARSQHTGVWTGSEMIIWGGISRDINGLTGQVTNVYLNSGGRYSPSTNSWTPTRLDGTTPTVRLNHTAVWTGSGMIVWGGEYVSGGSLIFLGGGNLYSPATDTWTAIASTSLQRRGEHRAVWTGSEMIVWGGTGSGGTLTTGGRYNPSTDSWVPTAVEPDYTGAAVWTGSEMIVWGTSSAVDPGGSPPAGLYSPATDNWRTGSGVLAPQGRTEHLAVWTGQEMIVWGGRTYGSYLRSGGRYNPTLDTWAITSVDASTPTERQGPTAVWTGSEMIVWGGVCGGTGPGTGGRYNPGTNTWTPTRSDASAPECRAYHTAVWTGEEMIVAQGRNSGRPSEPYNVSDYGRYDPVTDQWVVGATPDGRYMHTAVWTGTEMILWGGFVDSFPHSTQTGWRFNPAAGTFVATGTGPDTPSARTGHSAVWNGGEMIVWGGSTGSGGAYLNDGGRFNPGTDSWSPTRLDATTPIPRARHLAVWAGNEMIVWSGYGTSLAVLLDDGGRYCSCTAPVTYYRDLDGDGAGDSSTGVAFCGIPAGWVSVGGDCNDQDPDAWSLPGEALDLGFSDDVTLAWSAPASQGAGSLSYDLIRSPSAADFLGSGVCVATNTSSPGADDAASPAPGSIFFYLVRAENACPGGSGPLGNDSQGNPRSALSCP